MKRIVILLLFVPIISQGQINNLLKKGKEKIAKITLNDPKLDISEGLKEALNNGIAKQVSKLTETDGFYKNELVKIVLPSELQKVDKALRSLGLGKMADEGHVFWWRL